MSTSRKILCIGFFAIFVLSAGCAQRRSGVLPNLPYPVLRAGSNTSAPQNDDLRHIRTHTRQTWADASSQRKKTTPSIDAPAAWYPSCLEHTWKAIVVHHSAGNNGCAAVFDKAHRARGWDELGYHFVIGNGTGTPDGFTEVGSRWIKQKHGAHCKTTSNFYNKNGIGICLVGDFEHRYPTSRQLASLRKLLVFLVQRYDISPDKVYGHDELGSTLCPGKHLSMRQLRSWLDTNVQAWAAAR